MYARGPNAPRPRALALLHQSGSSHRCRIVGRPCGQFQGDLRPARVLTTRCMVLWDRCFPIMMEERQALDARTARTLWERCQRMGCVKRDASLQKESVSVSAFDSGQLILNVKTSGAGTAHELPQPTHLEGRSRLPGVLEGVPACSPASTRPMSSWTSASPNTTPLLHTEMGIID